MVRLCLCLTSCLFSTGTHCFAHFDANTLIIFPILNIYKLFILCIKRNEQVSMLNMFLDNKIKIKRLNN